jgi:hypothetical protein
LVLGEGVQVGKEHYATEDLLAERFHFEGKTFSNELIDFDNSLQQDGEIDLKGVNVADAYALMPERVERMERIIVEHFTEFNKNIVLHLKVLRDIEKAIVELRGVINRKEKRGVS